MWRRQRSGSGHCYGAGSQLSAQGLPHVAGAALPKKFLFFSFIFFSIAVITRYWVPSALQRDLVVALLRV